MKDLDQTFIYLIVPLYAPLQIYSICTRILLLMLLIMPSFEQYMGYQLLPPGSTFYGHRKLHIAPFLLSFTKTVD